MDIYGSRDNYVLTEKLLIGEALISTEVEIFIDLFYRKEQK